MFPIFNTPSEPFLLDASGIHYLDLNIVYRSHILPLNIENENKTRWILFSFEMSGKGIANVAVWNHYKDCIEAVSVMGISEVQGRYSTGGCYLLMQKGS